ncbi:unnamed protein product [Rotaria socialis]
MPNISTLYSDNQSIFQQDLTLAHEAKSTQQWLVGIKKVRRSNGKYSCLTESTFNEYANGRLPCDTMRIGDNLNRKSYGTAPALGSNLCADNMI